MHVCVCVCGERERERKIYYKELDHTIVKLCENWLADMPFIAACMGI